MLTLTADKLIEIFMDCHDFMKEFEKEFHALPQSGLSPMVSKLSVSEIMTITIAYHHSRMDCFKTYYKLLVEKKLHSYFPHLPTYEHFVTLKNAHLLELFTFLWYKRTAPFSQNANFIDSKKLPVCHLKREKSHQVMKGLAAKGKTSTGWFFGLKIHLVINEEGKVCRFELSGGNIADNNKNMLLRLFKGLVGPVFGDKGYISRWKAFFERQGAKLITKVRKNMKQKLLTPKEKHYLKKRGLIETVFGLLSFSCDLDHTRHRSPKGMMVNIYSALIAYSYFDHFPQIAKFSFKDAIENSDLVLFLEN